MSHNVFRYGGEFADLIERDFGFRSKNLIGPNCFIALGFVGRDRVRHCRLHVEKQV